MGLQAAIKLGLNYQEAYNMLGMGEYWHKTTNNTNKSPQSAERIVVKETRAMIRV